MKLTQFRFHIRVELRMPEFRKFPYVHILVKIAARRPKLTYSKTADAVLGGLPSLLALGVPVENLLPLQYISV